jgi:hypothetical protein
LPPLRSYHTYGVCRPKSSDPLPLRGRVREG